MRVHDLDTPCIVVDLAIMERNIERMSTYCREKNIQLRPHIKTHKIPELAKLQVKSGAIGIATAKVGEAEVMAEAGISDILIAYPTIGEQKTARLAKLAQTARISVSLDSEEAVRGIAQAMDQQGTGAGILVEIDVGFHRCGIGREQDAVALVRKIMVLHGLEFKGLMFFPGHLLVCPADQKRLREQVNAIVDRFGEAFEQAGIPIGVVSGGSTPTAFTAHEFHRVTEIRPGMYLFNDRNMLGAGVASLDDCAMSAHVTVVSKTVPGQVIVDGGSKTFSYDRFLSGDGRGFGLVKEDPSASLDGMSEEHGHLNVSKSARQYRLGERLTIIPNHVCATINMHDEIYGVRGEEVEVAWRVAARGKVR